MSLCGVLTELQFWVEKNENDDSKKTIVTLTSLLPFLGLCAYMLLQHLITPSVSIMFSRKQPFHLTQEKGHLLSTTQNTPVHAPFMIFKDLHVLKKAVGYKWLNVKIKLMNHT